ncbi:hypothetical protein M569_09860 [Genlisea aurea]|uniref:Uncharacterized protein n=1 Tax=Genlisea aurea TaxID=192259 RepID=S8DPG3_9LAMI|nr:hypothetical protein M569_09860 [Genlisea aurea]
MNEEASPGPNGDMNEEALPKTNGYMNEEALPEPNGGYDSEPSSIAANASRKRREGEKKLSIEARRVNGTFLALQKPSYSLRKGIENLRRDGGTLRSDNRKRLWWLLEECRSRHMWAEACGLLSVLLQATVGSYSPSVNRIKYKERILVQSEFIIDCLRHGNIEGARQDAVCLKQFRGFGSNAFANLVVGLVFARLWYSGLPEDLKLTRTGSLITYTQSEVPFECIFTSNDASEGGSAIFHANSGSGSSIALDKVHGGDPAFTSTVKVEQAEPLNDKSAEEDLQIHEGPPRHSIFYSQGLPLWLLPMNLPYPDGDLEDAALAHGELRNDHYNNAVNHLQAAIHMPNPKLEAFHPLIQMLLLGDQVAEALNEVEKLCPTSASEFQLRIKASLLELFDSSDSAKRIACFEEMLKKKPSCSYSVERLIHLHRQGEYEVTELMKMIALHLDASTGTCDAWQALASCLLRLSQCEGDRASTCSNGCDENDLNGSNKIPEAFTKAASRDVWRVRARWWRKRHFDCPELEKNAAPG